MISVSPPSHLYQYQYSISVADILANPIIDAPLILIRLI